MHSLTSYLQAFHELDEAILDDYISLWSDFSLLKKQIDDEHLAK